MGSDSCQEMLLREASSERKSSWDIKVRPKMKGQTVQETCPAPELSSFPSTPKASEKTGEGQGGLKRWRGNSHDPTRFLLQTSQPTMEDMLKPKGR